MTLELIPMNAVTLVTAARCHTDLDVHFLVAAVLANPKKVMTVECEDSVGRALLSLADSEGIEVKEVGADAD
jgi:hypothetical protein